MKNNINYKNMEKLFTEDILLKLKCSLTILLSNYLEYSEDNYWRFIYNEPDELKNIRKKTIEIIPQLEKIFANNMDDRNEILQEYLNYKNILGIIEKNMQNYMFECKYVTFYASYHANAAGILKNDSIKNISTDNIMEDCLDFIEDCENDFERNRRISELLSCIPVKMAREKYYDYIRNSIKLFSGANNQEDHIFTKLHINRYKAMFRPRLTNGYGEYFPSIAEKLYKFENLKMDDLSFEECEEILEKVSEIADELTIMQDYVLLLFESINSILILLTFTMDFDFYFHDNFVFKDAYFYIKESIETSKKTNNEHLFENEVKNILFEELDAVMERIDAISEKCNKFYKNTNIEDMPEAFRGGYTARGIVSEMFYENLTDLAVKCDKEEEINTSISIDENIEQLIDFIRDYLEQTPPKQQRLLKQYYMSFLICPFDSKELVEYIRYALSDISDSKNKGVTVLMILELFMYENNYNDCIGHKHDDEHEHSESCSCHCEH